MEERKPDPIQAPEPRRRRPMRESYSVTRLSVGSVLGQSFGIFFRYLVPVVGSAAVLVGLLVLIDLQSIAQFKDHVMPVAAWAEAPESFISTISATVVGYFLQGMFTFIVLQHLRGQSPSALAALSLGFTRTLRALPVALTIALVVGGLMVLQQWITIFATIPALILGLGWFVAVPVAATEGLGISDALSRSWKLTLGKKWSLFAVELVLGLLGFGVAFIFLFRLIQNADAATFSELRSVIITMHAITLPMVCLLAIAAPVAYYFLRTSREGIDAEELASVFD